MSLFNLKGKDLITTCDWSDEEINNLFELTSELKRKYYSGVIHETLKNKTFVMMFFNDSTRTRHSFDSGMTQLGGNAQYVRPENMRLSIDAVPTGKGESIKDTANVLSRLTDGIGIRLLAQSVKSFGEANRIIEEFATHASIPVINMMSEIWHPCQALTDIFTLKEKNATEGLRKKKIVIHWAYSPHSRDWASVQETAVLAIRNGMDVVVAQPKEYNLVHDVINKGKDYALNSGSKFEFTDNLDDALEGADFVYPRNWITLDYHERGKDEEKKLAEKYKDWRFTEERWAKNTYKKGKLVHCMPIDPNNEADVSLIDNPDVSILYDQAENRLHVQKALLTLTMGGKL
jgi:ornithine carbamoyltransferase